MKLKSILSKLSPGKKQKASIEETNLEEQGVGHEISFERRPTMIEASGSIAEIDVFVNDEKINIHSLAPATKIGRDPAQADIIIPELIVSKLHCTIYSRDDRFYIKDEESTNGVYIDNEKIEEQELNNGDTVLLGKKGSVKLVFHIRR